jgi:TonB family protein
MPQEARKTADDGICVVRLTVDANGMPQDMSVLRCSDPIFEPNTLKALAQYRFRPASNATGEPIAAQISVEVHFSFTGSNGQPLGRVPTAQIGYAFASLPGITSTEPDTEGVYPLTKQMEMPTLTAIVDKGYSQAAEIFDQGISCSIQLTLSAKGKPSDPQIEHCDKPTLEKPAMDTLMSSHFKPARLNGKPVAVRLIVRFIYKGFAPMK